MSIINRILEIIRARKKNNDLNVYKSLTVLSHDLKNNFIAIRAAAGSIKQYIKSPNDEININSIEKAITGIDRQLNHSITQINMMTMILSPISNWPQEVTSFSIKDCLQLSIQNYPFSSDKYASFINISIQADDFIVTGNIQLFMCIFYCLIKHGLDTLYNSDKAEVTINIEKNKVLFKYSESISSHGSKKNLYTLGNSENPGNGLIFINNVLKSINGMAEIYNIEDSSLVAVLHFT